MATAMKETKIETQVYGYTKHNYRDAYVVRVRIFGQGPRGKLVGMAHVGENDRDYDLKGDGRYSAMHGNSTLYFSDPIYAEIKKMATRAAQEWVTANPNALHEHKVREAETNISRLQADVTLAQERLDTNKQLLETAKETLRNLKGE